MNLKPTVFVVDDDDLARESLGALLQTSGLAYQGFPSAEAFLESYDPQQPGCVVANVRLVRMIGIELLERLAEADCGIPVVVITAYAETAMTLRAMQSGAVTLLEKPCLDTELLQAVRAALDRDRQFRQQQADRDEFRRRRALLSPEERRVMDLMIAGPTEQGDRLRAGSFGAHAGESPPLRLSQDAGRLAA
jgi:FixJ family two-component response regulator